MSDKNKQEYVNDVYLGLVEPVRVAFTPALAEARKVGGRGDPKFEVQVIFPPDHPDYLPMKKATADIARKKFGANVNIRDDLRLKFVNGDEEYEINANNPDAAKAKEYPQLQGQIVLKLRSKNPITVFDTRVRDARGIPVEITDKEAIRSTIYAGCYVSMKLTFATYDAPDRTSKPGVTIYPEQICFVKDGERLSSGGKSDGGGFAAVQGAVSDEDPTGSELDDEIPF